MTGDKDKLMAAFVAQRSAVLRFFTARTGNPATAEDLTQDIWRRIEGLAGDLAVANPLSYLRRMAANLAVDHRRSPERRLLDAADVHDLLDLAADAPSPEDIAAAREEMAALRRALDELPERRRAMFVAARVQDMPHKAIAARHGVSVRTVESEVARALEHCAKRLGRRRP